jgi:hypothetical protein
VTGLEPVGKVLVVGGLAMVVAGGLLWALARLTGLSELPGTIRVERPGFSCAVPILASILLSVLLTVVLNLVVRLLLHRGGR